jgi:hypothetical protein
MASNRPGLYSLEVGSHLQLPPRIWAPKMPISPKNGENQLKIGLITTKNSKLWHKNPLFTKKMGLAPSP